MGQKAQLFRLKLMIIIGLLLAGCASAGQYTPILRSEPAADSVQTRTPRTLRLFYDALPDVSQSSLKLEGPAGEYRLRGMHSMGADDLMVEIFEPAAVNGNYTVSWTTVVGDNPEVYQGSFNFSVQAN